MVLSRGFTLSILFLFYCININAQFITIKDAYTQKSIPEVLIMDIENSVFESTNKAGQVSLALFKKSEILQISHLGYEVFSINFSQLNKSNPIIYLKPSRVLIDELVISANKWKKNKNNISSKIAALDKNAISFENSQTSADLLANSGEVYIQKSQQGGGSPMIRGFSTNRLIYVVDGIRMNTAIFRSGNIQNVISLDPFEMERVEVLFGPGAVTYGSDAIGGVMSFNTLKPRLSANDKIKFNGTSTIRYSSANNENTIHTDFNFGLKKLGFATSFTYSKYGDLKMGSNGPDDFLKYNIVKFDGNDDKVFINDDPRIQNPTAYNQINFMQKVRYHFSENWDLTLSSHYSETSEYGRYDRHLRQRNSLPRYAEWNYGPQIWNMNTIHLNHLNESKFYDEINIKVAYQLFEESRISRNLYDNIRNIQSEKVNAYSFNLDIKKELSDKSKLYYGLESVINDVVSEGENEDIFTSVSSDAAPRYPQSKWYSNAAYLSYDQNINYNWHLQAGVRYNAIKLQSQFDNSYYNLPFDKINIDNAALSTSLGIVHTINRNKKISINFANAFRSPNVDDIGKIFDSAPGKVIVPNPDLAPEKSHTFDLNYEQSFEDDFSFNVSAFYTYLKDALVRRNFTLNNQDSILYLGELSQVQAIQNAAFIEVLGINVNASVQLSNDFELSSTINLQKGIEELEDGSISAARHEAPTFGDVKLRYSHHKVKATLAYIFNLGKSYEDLPAEERDKTEIYAKDVNGLPYSPSWSILNLKTQYQLNENFKINIAVENILDKRYRPYSSGLAGAGRNFVGSFTANF